MSDVAGEYFFVCSWSFFQLLISYHVGHQEIDEN